MGPELWYYLLMSSVNSYPLHLLFVSCPSQHLIWRRYLCKRRKMLCSISVCNVCELSESRVPGQWLLAFGNRVAMQDRCVWWTCVGCASAWFSWQVIVNGKRACANWLKSTETWRRGKVTKASCCFLWVLFPFSVRISATISIQK